MSILVIIPARGGSKGVLKKNIRNLNGLPLIAYTILAAKKVNDLTNIIVSTDSKEIASVSRKYGAEIPFIRPQHLATDTASGIDVIMHAIEFYESQGSYYDDVMVLQPTSPLRDDTDIKNCLEIYYKNKCDSVISVCEAQVHPYLYRIIDENGALQDFIHQDDKHMRRQDMPVVYQLNGAIYITSVKVFKERKSFYGDIVLPYVMDNIKSIDIDTELDLKVAELIMKERMKHA
jgi:CMP-N-acetylneuraminic acid synthetase